MTAEQGCAGGAVTTIGMGGCGDIGAVGGATGAETRAMPGGMGDPSVSTTPTLVRPASKLVAPVGAVGVAVRAVLEVRERLSWPPPYSRDLQ